MRSTFHLLILLLAVICHLPQIRGKPESAVSCGNRLPAYMVLDNSRLQSSIAHEFENITEFDCTYICSDNRDKKSERITCGSFNYIHKNKTCFIYKDRAIPSGSKSFVQDVKHRYFEKFCLPDGSPLECGESTFLRAEQHVLNGFAVNVTRTKRLDVCIQACLELNGLCKSVMFFYQVGECIMNSGSSQDSEEGLVEETGDKVVYVENGCVLGKKGKVEAEKQRPDDLREKPSTIDVDSEKPRNTEGSSVSERPEEIKEKVTKSPHPAQDRGSFVVDEKKVAEGDKKFVDNKPDESDPLTSTSQSTSTEEPSSTAVHSSTEEALSSTVQSTPDEASTTEQTGGLTTEEDQKQESQNEIASAWSQWSECDRPDGRQVRRRTCKANSKLCRGKLLESRSCVATTTVLPDEEVSVSQRRSTTWKPPGDEPPTGAWTVWSKKCQPFPKGVPCDKGKKVGFQTRQCLGTPFECHGPFMRYCFISC